MVKPAEALKSVMMMTTRRLQFKNLLLAFGASLFLGACDTPTTGQEMYDGDPKTNEETPDDMKERAEAERKDTTLEH